MKPQQLLEAINLKVFRGGALVLDIPHLSIPENGKVAVIAPNGGSKSSLLLTLACLLPRTEGTIRFAGKTVEKKDETEYRRTIAMLFQEPLLFDTTVLDNVAEGLRIRGVEKKAAREESMEALELFRVAHLASRSAHKLSGGEAQRVSLARAFAVKPKLILMDEPFSSLDLPTRIMLAEELGEILHNSGTAALIATHDRIEALRMVEHLIVMDAGKIIQSGDPAEVIENPVNDFVAAFKRSSHGPVHHGENNRQYDR